MRPLGVGSASPALNPTVDEALASDAEEVPTDEDLSEFERFLENRRKGGTDADFYASREAWGAVYARRFLREKRRNGANHGGGERRGTSCGGTRGARGLPRRRGVCSPPASLLSMNYIRARASDK
jgi:hypothetical protein